MRKEAFTATSVVSAVIVDAARLAVYGFAFTRQNFERLPFNIMGTVSAATLAAFFGAYFGARLISKITLRMVQLTVAVSMAIVGFCLAAGLL
jgi:uncharacterized protein